MVLTVRFYTKKNDFFIKKTKNRGLSLFFPVDFCQSYIFFTNSLRERETDYRLDEVAVNVSKLVDKYTPRYYPDWDFYWVLKGRLYRYASPVYNLQ